MIQLEKLWEERLKFNREVERLYKQIDEIDLFILTRLFTPGSYYVNLNFPKDYHIYLGCKRYPSRGRGYAGSLLRISRNAIGATRAIFIAELLTEWAFIPIENVPEHIVKRAENIRRRGKRW